MTELNAMSCEAFEAQLANYLAGRLSDADAEVLESHASTCVNCEARLEQASRLSMPLVVDVSPSMRRETLQAVMAQSASAANTSPVVPAASSARRNDWRLRSWRSATVILATAAALVVVIARRQPTSTENLADTATVATAEDSAPSIASALVVQGSGMQQVAAQLASDEASEEFLELDAAARELEAALERTPSDRELRAYLNTVRARRDELSRRVREATS